jgi:hypothetical protein
MFRAVRDAEKIEKLQPVEPPAPTCTASARRAQAGRER